MSNTNSYVCCEFNNPFTRQELFITLNPCSLPPGPPKWPPGVDHAALPCSLISNKPLASRAGGAPVFMNNVILPFGGGKKDRISRTEDGGIDEN